MFAGFFHWWLEAPQVENSLAEGTSVKMSCRCRWRTNSRNQRQLRRASSTCRLECSRFQTRNKIWRWRCTRSRGSLFKCTSKRREIGAHRWSGTSWTRWHASRTSGREALKCFHRWVFLLVFPVEVRALQVWALRYRIRGLTFPSVTCCTQT